MATPERATRPAPAGPVTGDAEALDVSWVSGLLDAEETRLRRLLAALDATGDGGSASGGALAGVSQHPADRGTDTFEREFDTTLAGDVRDELAAVADARRRLAAGRYGRCERCHGPIGAERLEAVPATRFCLVHEERFELGGTHLEDLARPATEEPEPEEAEPEESEFEEPGGGESGFEGADPAAGGFDPAELLPDDDETDADAAGPPPAEDAALRVRHLIELDLDLDQTDRADRSDADDSGPAGDRPGDVEPDLAGVVDAQLYRSDRNGPD